MKMIAAVVVGLLALTNALPAEVDANRENRLISDQIVAAIEDLSHQIREAGLDPFRIEDLSVRYALPVPILLDVFGHLSDFVVTGLSNIIVNNMSYGLLTSRLTLNVSLPRIDVSLGHGDLDTTVLGVNAKADSRFKFAIVNACIAGRIQVNVGIISGIFLRDSNLDFTLGGIEFYGNVDIFGHNLSYFVREFLTKALPNQISVLRNDINELINILVLDIGNRILN